MVTRTIHAVEVKVLGVNVDARETEERTFILTGRTQSADKMLKRVADMCDEGFKPVNVLGITEVETLYGMSEETFIEHAVKIEKR